MLRWRKGRTVSSGSEQGTALTGFHTQRLISEVRLHRCINWGRARLVLACLRFTRAGVLYCTSEGLFYFAKDHFQQVASGRFDIYKIEEAQNASCSSRPPLASSSGMDPV